MNRQHGNMLPLVAVSMSLLTLIGLFVMNFNQLLCSHKQAQNAVDAATLQAAKDIGRIVISGKSGMVALVDDAPVGGDPNKRPVSGINSLMARIRLDAIIAEKLGDPIMISIARQELQDALSDRLTLMKTIAGATGSSPATARDKDGHPIDIRANAEDSYNANRNRSGFGELDGHLTVTAGVMKQPTEKTNIPIPTPNDLSQTDSSNTVNKDGMTFYKASTAIATSALPQAITFVPTADEVALIDNQNFKATGTDEVPYAVQITGSHRVSAIASSNKESMAIIATAQVGGPRITAPSGSLTLTLPGTALIGNGSVKLESPISLIASAGNWRQGKPGQWSPHAHGRSEDDASQALSVMTYDWIRSLGLRPDIASLDTALKRHFNTISLSGKHKHKQTIELAGYERIVAIDSFGIEHTVNAEGSPYQLVQSLSAGPGASSGSGGFTANLGGDFADTTQTIQNSWILVQKGSVEPVAAAPAHYSWLNPGAYTTDPNLCPSNAATIPTNGIQLGTTARSRANISNFYQAPVFTNILTMPRHPKPPRYYSFKDNHFYNLSGSTYVMDPSKPTLAELCSRNGVQVDAPWVTGQQAMGGSDSVCPHRVFLRSLSESYFEVYDTCMNVGPMINPTTAYPHIFMYTKPTTSGGSANGPTPNPPGVIGVAPAPGAGPAPGTITPQPYYGPITSQPPAAGPAPAPAPPPKKNPPSSGPVSPTPTTPAAPPVATPAINNSTYIYFVRGDVTNPNDLGAGQIKVVRLASSPFTDGVIAGQSAYDNPEANLVYAGSTVSPSLTWKVRGRNLNANNAGEYFADTEAPGHSNAIQDFFGSLTSGQYPSLVSEWIIYQ